MPSLCSNLLRTVELGCESAWGLGRRFARQGIDSLGSGGVYIGRLFTPRCSSVPPIKSGNSPRTVPINVKVTLAFTA